MSHQDSPLTITDEAEVTALWDDVVALLDRHRVMSLATNRADGWPQATLVNYLRQDHALVFVVARQSQKFANLSRDPRASIAIGGQADSGPQGLSMAVQVSEITAPERLAALNSLVWAQPEGAAFAPHPGAASVAVLEARPEVVSLVDYTVPPGRRRQATLGEAWRLRSS